MSGHTWVVDVDPFSQQVTPVGKIQECFSGHLLLPLYPIDFNTLFIFNVVLTQLSDGDQLTENPVLKKEEDICIVQYLQYDIGNI